MSGRASGVMEISIKSQEPLYRTTYLGQRWVGGEPDTKYVIRLDNGHKYMSGPRRALFVVTVDGLNVIDGTPGDTQGPGYVVDAGETDEIEGWRKSMGKIAAFRLSAAADSYAAATGEPSNTGVIGVAVFHEESAPLAEYLGMGVMRGGMSKGLGGVAPASMGTAYGEELASPVSAASFDRKKQAFSITTIRYDSTDNLIKAGILPPNVRKPVRQPEAFPVNNAFCQPPPTRG